MTAQAQAQARRDAFHAASGSRPDESPGRAVREHRAHLPRAVTDRGDLVALRWLGRVYREKPSHSGDREQKEPGQ
jgi:hypothetical protein